MSGFVDEAQLHAKAGDGGAGAVSFRREAHVARGGPDGGDGGHGGDVWLVADLNQASLLGFKDHPFRRAGDGSHGSGKRRHGQRGADLVVPVPVGTVVRDRDGTALRDLSTPEERWLAAEGGHGGRGNARFLSNARRAPAFAEQGERGAERWLDLELKLTADVALVGFPNAGKSTLISTISAARPKIADYPFTTLQPHLGVVRVGGGRDESELVVADVPGLVEGAAEGKGLGHRFLRHVERTRVLVVLVDLSPSAGMPAAEQLGVLLGELGRYEPGLLARPRLVVGSKADVAAGDAGEGVALDLVISAATGDGVQVLVHRMAGLVADERKVLATSGDLASAAQPSGPDDAFAAHGASAEPRETVVHRPAAEGIVIERTGPRAWRVSGRDAQRAVNLSDLTDDAALAEAVRRLRRLGVDRALARAGARDGDEVAVGEVAFTWFRDQPVELPSPDAAKRSGGRRTRRDGR
ncbi:MAG TPA: GTPase ObgE [Acidimicrobiales bacterium]|nr:GTPase ObgE [Acidimicrobiales bacterium]